MSPTKWKSLWWVTKIRKRASIHRILYCCPLLSYIFDLLGFQAATTLLFWAQVNRCFRIASKLPACCHTVVQNGTSKLQLALRLIQTSRPTRSSSSLPLELTEHDGKFWRIHSKNDSIDKHLFSKSILTQNWQDVVQSLSSLLALYFTNFC